MYKIWVCPPPSDRSNMSNDQGVITPPPPPPLLSTLLIVVQHPWHLYLKSIKSQGWRTKNHNCCQSNWSKSQQVRLWWTGMTNKSILRSDLKIVLNNSITSNRSKCQFSLYMCAPILSCHLYKYYAAHQENFTRYPVIHIWKSWRPQIQGCVSGSGFSWRPDPVF